MGPKVSQSDLYPKPSAPENERHRASRECYNEQTNSLATHPQTVEPKSLLYCGPRIPSRETKTLPGNDTWLQGCFTKTWAPSFWSLITHLTAGKTNCHGTWHWRVPGRDLKIRNWSSLGCTWKPVETSTLQHQAKASNTDNQGKKKKKNTPKNLYLKNGKAVRTSHFKTLPRDAVLPSSRLAVSVK